MRKLLLAVILAVPVALASSIGFVQTNLASDATDANLVNAWGIAASGSSPFWLGANGSGTSVLYNGTGGKIGLTVSIPGDGSVTGVAFNNLAAAFNGDLFLFASEDGTVSGWRGALGSTAERFQVADPANVYKGLADTTVGGNQYAYLANFKSGNIDILKGSAGAPDLTGKFVDPNLPAGYAPFNVAVLGGSVYVTYALQGVGKDEDSGLGHGFVDKYDLNGNLLAHLISQGLLNSPWGLAIAPPGFGNVGGDLLVGNFGDGMIHAYDPVTGALVETLTDVHGNPIVIDGLWGLSFGNGGNAGSPNTLYFTAGPNDESQGLFGRLDPVPEPSTWLLTGLSLLGLGLYSRSSAARNSFVSRRNKAN